MNVTSIGSLLSDAASLYRHEDERHAESLESSTSQRQASDNDNNPQQSRIRNNPLYRQALGGYDVTRIRPGELTDMVRQIDRAGLLGPEELGELTQIRIELHQEDVDADQPVNLLQLVMRRLQEVNESTEQTSGTDAELESPEPGDAAAESEPDPDSENPGTKPEPPAASRDTLMRRFNLLHKISILQETPERMGVDALV